MLIGSASIQSDAYEMAILGFLQPLAAILFAFLSGLAFFPPYYSIPRTFHPRCICSFAFCFHYFVLTIGMLIAAL
ncbi:hypothetical protein B0O99DRAFT_175721 [Bisporella sp. PMI_857]|nr:hypothetical protein B0O99DRAFT_175721 [Bisporella sp. PMI_857]